MSAQILPAVLRLASVNETFRRRMIARLRKRLAFTLLPLGKTLFNPKNNLRYHRYADNLQVMDMVNAGKRGKQVPYFYLHFPQQWDDPGLEAIVSGLISEVMSAPNYSKALQTAKDMIKDVQSGVGDDAASNARVFLSLSEGTRRGVDVTPMGNEVKLDAQKFTLESTPTDFTIRDKEDKYNYPVAIPARRAGRTQAAKFFKWLRMTDGALAKLENLSFNEVIDQVLKVTGQYPHTWSSMD